MTTPGTEWLRASVEVDYGQWYLFDPDNPDVVPGDLVDNALLWEHKCASHGGSAIVYTLKQYGATEVVARSLPEAPPVDAAADHVAECSVRIESGRLALTGWDSTVVAAVLDVPTAPLRMRIGWYGLDAEVTPEESQEHFMIEVFPGPEAPVEVVRWWPPWVVPSHEWTSDAGLRRFLGSAAAQAREPMEWIPRTFWSPYPTIAEGTVTSLWRDPRDGSQWAHGTGEGSHNVLIELTPEEFAALDAQGYPSVRTYAIDSDGRIWTSDVMPIDRVPCLNLVPRWQFDMVRGMSGGLVGTAVIDLPPGWSRVFRLPRDGVGQPVQVDSIDDAEAVFYQRWPDDRPWPPE